MSSVVLYFDQESFEKEEALLQGRIDELIHSLATSEQSHRMKQQQKVCDMCTQERPGLLHRMQQRVNTSSGL